MNKESLKLIGNIFYFIAAADFAGMFLGYDFTGVEWSPLAFGGIGLTCIHYAKEVNLGEGEELLMLKDGKKADVSVNIGSGVDSSHKLWLTNQKLKIDGGKEEVELPYSEIQSVSKDTYMKMDMALKLVTREGNEYKLTFGMGRSKKRDYFLERISSMLTPQNSGPTPYAASSPTMTATPNPTHSVTTPPNPPEMNSPDMIYITRGGQQHGPYSSEQTRAMLASGELSVSDQAWYEGASGWMPLNQVPGIAS
jgi:hypothetical protein